MDDALLVSLGSVTLGSIFLLLGAEYPKARQLLCLVLGFAALVFALLAFWQMPNVPGRSFGAYIVASLALSNFAVALKRFKSSDDTHS